jgi:hypothetical protein
MTEPEIIIDPNETIDNHQDDMVTPEGPTLEPIGTLREMQEVH